ncbi:uncharacterized protein LOC133866276 [Alnus glutinosa]|uniref:uncharacterized protein LOC133866276 n=1 Tax=Alnus glutinosa TaxID=3517 RepID=UPI002D768CA3|nr:uncharacterized protein LOC133866276 [Alnus glutinosa]
MTEFVVHKISASAIEKKKLLQRPVITGRENLLRALIGSEKPGWYPESKPEPEKRQGVRDGLKDSLLPTRLLYHHHPTLSFFLSLPCPLLYKAPLRFTSPHLITISSHFISTIYFLSLFRYLFITSTTSSSLVEARKGKKRVRLDSDEFSESDSPEVKRLREDLLGFLDDTEPDPTIQEIDSVVKSFEKEISQACTSSSAPVVDLMSDSGESQPELGLPPSGNSLGEEVKNPETDLGLVSSYSSGIGEICLRLSYGYSKTFCGGMCGFGNLEGSRSWNSILPSTQTRCWIYGIWSEPFYVYLHVFICLPFHRSNSKCDLIFIQHVCCDF